MTDETVTTPEGGRSKKAALGLKPYQKPGKCRLQKRLGKGGYCKVWKARDTVEGIRAATELVDDVFGRADGHA